MLAVHADVAAGFKLLRVFTNDDVFNLQRLSGADEVTPLDFRASTVIDISALNRFRHAWLPCMHLLFYSAPAALLTGILRQSRGRSRM